jgi:hypothetical protein
MPDPQPQTTSAATPPPGYPDRFVDLFARRGEPVAVIGGSIYKLYSNMVVPFGAAAADHSLSREDAARALGRLGGMLVRTTGGFDSGRPDGDWYAIVCRRFTDVADHRSSNTRSKLRRALRNGEVRRLEPAELARDGYGVYVNAQERYTGAGAPPSRDAYAEHILAAEGFDDITQYWGVFCDGTLAGYTIAYTFGTTEALYSAVKFDPAYLRRYTSYALFHRMNEHYLAERGVEYVNNGFRSILHDTQVQSFLEQTFGFEKAYTRLDTRYRAPYGALVRATLPLRGLIGRVDERFGALYEIERVARASR